MPHTKQTDSQILRQLRQEQAKTHALKQLIWLILQKHGGEIRLSKRAQALMTDEWELCEYTDEETREIVITTTAAKPNSAEAAEAKPGCDPRTGSDYVEVETSKAKVGDEFWEAYLQRWLPIEVRAQQIGVQWGGYPVRRKIQK